TDFVDLTASEAVIKASGTVAIGLLDDPATPAKDPLVSLSGSVALKISQHTVTLTDSTSVLTSAVEIGVSNPSGTIKPPRDHQPPAPKRPARRPPRRHKGPALLHPGHAAAGRDDGRPQLAGAEDVRRDGGGGKQQRLQHRCQGHRGEPKPRLRKAGNDRQHR